MAIMSEHKHSVFTAFMICDIWIIYVIFAELHAWNFVIVLVIFVEISCGILCHIIYAVLFLHCKNKTQQKFMLTEQTNVFLINLRSLD